MLISAWVSVDAVEQQPATRRQGLAACRGVQVLWGGAGQRGQDRSSEGGRSAGEPAEDKQGFGQCLLIYQGGVFWVGIFLLQPFCLPVSNNHCLGKKGKS